MRTMDRDWHSERRQHQDGDDWYSGVPSRERLVAEVRTSGRLISDAVQTLLVTVEEAARLLGIGRTTMFELIARGNIKSVRLGRRRLIARKNLESFVDELAVS